MSTDKRVYLTSNESGYLFCIAVAASYVYQLLLGLFLQDQALLWAYSFGTPVVYAACVLIGCAVRNVHPIYALQMERRPRATSMLLSAAMAVAAIAAFYPIATGVQQLFALMGYRQTPLYADYTSSAGRLVLGLFGLALLPAMGEELLLRGVVFGGLRRNGTVRAIVLSALIFALMHGSPVQFVHQLMIGLLMAYIVYMTGSLYNSVLFHFVNNALVLVYDYIYVATGATFVITWWMYLIMAVVGLGALAGLIIALARTCRLRDEGGMMYGSIPRLLQGQSEYTAKAGRLSGGTWAALGLVALLWLVNTIVGWIA